ncbi:hypothetical protein ACWF76_25340 [Streptomyces globisporus]|uniref:hypothetical protein n=1 Tax=Streptomyces sp. MCL20-2 TaxID=2967219 RepID=UPI0029669F47|nr:hypothetical protein [Streptomyces sp. MCL20-2]
MATAPAAQERRRRRPWPFLLLDRTSALPPPIGTDAQFALEERLSGIGAVASDRLVLLVLAAGVMMAALYVLLRPVRKRRSDVEDREPSAQG